MYIWFYTRSNYLVASCFVLFVLMVGSVVSLNIFGVSLTYQAAPCTWMMKAKAMIRAMSVPSLPKRDTAKPRAMVRFLITVPKTRAFPSAGLKNFLAIMVEIRKFIR